MKNKKRIDKRVNKIIDDDDGYMLMTINNKWNINEILLETQNKLMTTLNQILRNQEQLKREIDKKEKKKILV